MKPADIPASTDKNDQARWETAAQGDPYRPPMENSGGASAPPSGLRTGDPEPPLPGDRVHQQAWMSGLLPADPAPGFDPSVPHPARVYSYWLGGKDHYPADRRAAEEVIRTRPQVVAGARANRAFLAWVVRYLAAECGIRQFLDIGTGLPAPGNTYQVAQAIAPDARIVYVDSDPLVLVHARALLTSTPPRPLRLPRC